METTKRDSGLEPFDALIGTWATEATHLLFDGVVPVVPGSITFERLRRRPLPHPALPERSRGLRLTLDCRMSRTARERRSSRWSCG
jgi:hypothetical protein